jgi:hypothetical protein
MVMYIAWRFEEIEPGRVCGREGKTSEKKREGSWWRLR